MSEVIAQMIIPALGIGLSPIPIIATVVVLGTATPKKNGVVFTAGWVVGLTALCLVVLLAVDALGYFLTGANQILDAIRIVLGIGLLILAVKKWSLRPRSAAEIKLPSWMKSIDTMPTSRFFALGATLGGANPKNIAFAFAAVAAVAEAGVTVQSELPIVALFVLLSSLFILGAVGLTVLSEESVKRPLGSIKDFMTTYNTHIMVVLFLIFGVMLIKSGIT